MTLGLLGCVAGAAWIFWGGNLGPSVVGNSNFVGAIASIVSVGILIATYWRSQGPGADASITGWSTPALVGGLSTGEARALEYLASETLRHWGQQALFLRIRTPTPAAVAWRWARDEIAVPPMDLPKNIDLITNGKVELLREQLFSRLPAGRARIVILGGAGAGKTSAMILLLINLLEHRKPAETHPVPVWLSLGSWDPNKESVLDYAASIILRDYPGVASPVYGGSSVARKLIRAGLIMLCMDGLDEMPRGMRGLALIRINQDSTNLPIVLTSRSAEYEQALVNGRLHGAAVIELLPLTPSDAGEFLIRGQVGKNRVAWRRVAQHLVSHTDSVTARTLTTPLSVVLARDSFGYPNQPLPSALLNEQLYPTPDALLNYLVASFLSATFPSADERERSLHWLRWIASRLGEERDIAWWTIPTWLPQRQMRIARGTAGLVVGAILGSLAGGYAGNVAGGPADARLCAVIFGLGAALISGGLFAWGPPLKPEILAGFGAVGAGPRALSLRIPTLRQVLNLFTTIVVEFLRGCVWGFIIGGSVGAVIGEGFGLLHDILVVGTDVGALSTAPIAYAIIFCILGMLLGPLSGGIIRTTIGGLIGTMWSLFSVPLATSPLVTPDSVRRNQRRYQALTGIFAGIGIGLSLSVAITGLLAISWRYLTFNGGRQECLAEGFVHCGLGQGDIVKIAVAVGLAGGSILTIMLTFFDDLTLTSIVLFCTGNGRISFRALLKRAHAAGLLRQAGAVYEFRHYIFQTYLASKDEATETDPARVTTEGATEKGPQ